MSALRSIAAVMAGVGTGLVARKEDAEKKARQDKLDAQANELHTAKMSEIVAAQDERQRERDFREANVAALSTGKTDTGQVVTDAAGSNAYTKDADAAAVLQDMAQTANGGAQVAPATRVLTGMQGATQRGTIPGQQVFTDPAKAQEFAQSMPMTEYAKLKERQRVAEQYGKLEIADDMRAKLENLASKGVFKASSLLDSGNADGALKVLQDMNPDLVPKGAQFKQVDVPDMFDRTKTAKGWALVAPGAEGQPERVLVGDFRDAVFGYLTPQEQFGQENKVRELRLKERELEEVKIPNAETQRELLSIKTAIAQMRASGSGSSGQPAANSFDPLAGFDSKQAQAAATAYVDKKLEEGGMKVSAQERARLITEHTFALSEAHAGRSINRQRASVFLAEARKAKTPQEIEAVRLAALDRGFTPAEMAAFDPRFKKVDAAPPAPPPAPPAPPPPAPPAPPPPPMVTMEEIQRKTRENKEQILKRENLADKDPDIQKLRIFAEQSLKAGKPVLANQAMSAIEQIKQKRYAAK